MVGRTTNHIDKTIEIFLSDENGSLGFNETEYLKFESLIQKFLSLEYLNKFVTFNFIETEAFNWVIDVYKKQKAIDKKDLQIFHLVDKAEEAFKIIKKSSPHRNRCT